MNAKAHIKGADFKGRLPSRLGTGSGDCAPPFAGTFHESINAALHPSDIPNEIAEIFKKTPCAAGLQPGGRYVAKDRDEVGSIPLLMKTLLDHGHLNGNCVTVTGQPIAENLKSAKPITVTGGVVGLNGKLAPEGAVVKVAGMLQDGDIEIGGAVGIANVKLSAFEPAEHETRWRPRATNQTLGALWKYAQDVGPAVDGAVIHPCGAHEKQCYADI